MSANEPAAHQTLNDLFDTSVSQHSSNSATRYLPCGGWGGRLTYDRLAGHVERFASRGHRRGRRAALRRRALPARRTKG